MRILLIDDNETNSLFVEALLTRGRRGDVDFEVRREVRLYEALQRLQAEAARFDAILLDLGHPECGGLTTLNLIKAHAPSVPVVVVTSLDHPDTIEQVRLAGARGYLIKGKFDAPKLETALLDATDQTPDDASSPELQGTFLRGETE